VQLLPALGRRPGAGYSGGSMMRLPFLGAVLAALTGCGTHGPSLPLGAATAPVYDSEHFDAGSPHSRHYARRADELCEGARRTLMGQGYVLSRDDPLLLNGRKYFQPERELHVELSVQVNCRPEGPASAWGVIYVTAWQDKFVVKKSVSSSSLGLSAFGSISLPWNSSDDSLVKIGIETVRDRPFYERFYTLLDRMLPQRPVVPGAP
jgi:predicted small lipoprotein YifL